MQTLSPKQQEMLTDVNSMQGQYEAVNNPTSRALLHKGFIRQVDDRFEITDEGEQLWFEIVRNAFENASSILKGDNQ